MPKRSNEFQRLVTRIYSLLAEHDVSVTESAELREQSSGQSREIDILLEGTVVGHQVRVAIECRDHARKAGTEWIDSLIGKYSDLPVSEIVAVSRTGYTKGAMKKAAAHSITLLGIQEAIDRDWPAGFQRVGLLALEVSVELQSMTPHLDPALEGNRPLTVLVGDRDAGSIGDFLQRFWTNQLGPEIRQWIGQNLIRIYPTRAELEKPLLVCHEGSMNGVQVRSEQNTLHNLTRVITQVLCKPRTEEVSVRTTLVRDALAAAGEVKDSTGNIRTVTLLQQANAAEGTVFVDDHEEGHTVHLGARDDPPCAGGEPATPPADSDAEDLTQPLA